MSIKSELIDDGKSLRISIEGRFDATLLDSFRRSFEEHDQNVISTYIVDMKETMHLDSSALGMLLVLRDHAGGDKADVRIENCSADVRKIFAISSFDQLFQFN